MNLNNVNSITYEGKPWGVKHYQQIGDWVYFDIKKRLNCRVCHDKKVKIQLVNDSLDYSTLTDV